MVSIANVISVIDPYAAMYIGAYMAIQRGYVGIGYEYLIPVSVMFISGMLRGVANKLGKGITIPVPANRFTEVGSDGEVSIPVERSEELILYMADLEDWLEKNGAWKSK